MPDNDNIPGLDELRIHPLPEPLASRREELIFRHRKEVFDLTACFHEAWEEILGHEIHVHHFDGMTSPAAELAAENNLAVCRQELENDLLDGLCRLFDELRGRLARLIEDAEDYS